MADYVELTIKVDENSATDSQSSLEERVKNNSKRNDEESKLTKQARENMKENNPKENIEGVNGKAIKSFIINDVIKESSNIGIRILEETASQSFKYGGNSAAMNKMNNTINQIRSGISIGTGIAGYATAGATMGGPWGAAIGAVVGVIFTAVDSIVTYNTNNAQLQWDLQRERLAAQGEANRLGIAASGRGRIPFREFRL